MIFFLKCRIYSTTLFKHRILYFNVCGSCGPPLTFSDQKSPTDLILSSATPDRTNSMEKVHSSVSDTVKENSAGIII